MIINNSQSPSLSLYYIGANIITIMRAHQFNSICPTILYRKYCRKIKNISYSYFINGLDWLYLIKVIELKDNGDITLCN
ncbi:hypothetical protein UB37_17005 [Photobacterium iliopiscarium]|uniref:Uncharacterized protein n=2 Tax=Photobacterium iliopiscarium TaxID=56192 RepID=A0ABX5GTL1_9GAMM|nr:hypothetical protein UB37_17005 [Photobacterium iliopiscarium]PSW98210.1 hypothetical protein C9J52_08450 [Photobacterium iliopiscarium]